MTRLHTDADPSAKRVLVIHGKRLLGFISCIAVGSFTASSWSAESGMPWPVSVTLSLAVSAFLGIVFSLLFGWPFTELERYRTAPDLGHLSLFAPSQEAHQRILQSILTALWMRELFLAFQYREVVRRLEGE